MFKSVQNVARKLTINVKHRPLSHLIDSGPAEVGHLFGMGHGDASHNGAQRMGNASGRMDSLNHYQDTVTLTGTFSSPSKGTLSARHRVRMNSGFTILAGSQLKISVNPSFPSMYKKYKPISESASQENGEPFLLNVFPNPIGVNATINIAFSNLSDNLKKAPAKITFYNVSGKLVKEMPLNIKANGVVQLNWYGKNASSRMLPSGIYLAKVSIGSLDKYSKIVVY